MPEPATTPEPPPLFEATRPEARHLRAVGAAADTAPPDTATPDPTAAGTAATDAETSPRRIPTSLVAWLRAAFLPGSGLYSERQPSISEDMRRARHGAQLADKGPLRKAAIGYGYVDAANKAVFKTWMWIVEHPARMAVFGVLLALAVAFPVTRHLLSVLLTPFVWAQQALD